MEMRETVSFTLEGEQIVANRTGAGKAANDNSFLHFADAAGDFVIRDRRSAIEIVDRLINCRQMGSQASLILRLFRIAAMPVSAAGPDPSDRLETSCE